MKTAYEHLFDTAKLHEREVVVLSQHGFAPGRAYTHRERLETFAQALRAYAVRSCGAEVKTAYLGKRVVPAAIELFWLVKMPEAAANLLRWGAQNTPGVPLPWVAVRQNKSWHSIAPDRGVICSLADDGPSRQELQARADALTQRSAELAAIKEHLQRVKAREDEIAEQLSVSLVDHAAALAARAWVAEQLEAIDAALRALIAKAT